jgi:membrane protease subunit HflK
VADEHHHHHHHHHHDEPSQPDHPLAISGETLDPAEQSLADALKASFRLLKFIMLLLVIVFLFSGVFIVDQTKVAVVARFGQKLTGIRQPGLHFALPRPIDEIVYVSTAPQTIVVDSFWLRLSEQEKMRDLSELSRGRTLDPASEGALITGDKAIMHMLMTVQYSILPADAEKYVENVGQDNKSSLLRSILLNAAIAEAARTTADMIWKDPGQVAGRVRNRAQEVLDRMETGIQIDQITADKSYFPLQAAAAFLNVSTAENKKIELINAAKSERAKMLNGAAGEAWEELAEEILKLDQVDEGPDRQEVIDRIETILMEEATGEAGGKIQIAQAERDKIIAMAEAEVRRFESLLPEYRRNPELVVERFRQRTLEEVYEMEGVSKWMVPEGAKQLVLWLNKDPIAEREAELARTRAQIEAQ